MATVVTKAGLFTSGETVNAYKEGRVGEDYTKVAAVTTGIAASDGSVSITGLTSQAHYVLVGQTSARVWRVDAPVAVLAPDGEDAPGVVLPYSTLRFGTPSTLTPVANTLYLCKFTPRVDAVITKIAFEVTTLDAADPATEVVIVSQAGARLATSGSQTGVLTTTGVKTLALATPLAVVRGTAVYAGLVTASAAVAAVRSASLTNLATTTFLGTNMPAQPVGSIAAMGPPCPASPGTTLAGITGVPHLAVRVD